MSKKQTAVQWLEQEYAISGMLTIDDFNIAIAMEREQIEDAYDKGFDDGAEDIKVFNIDYYNETYGKESK